MIQRGSLDIAVWIHWTVAWSISIATVVNEKSSKQRQVHQSRTHHKRLDHRRCLLTKIPLVVTDESSVHDACPNEMLLNKQSFFLAKKPFNTYFG